MRDNLPIGEATVMGQLPVLVTSTFLAGAGFLQVFELPGSKILRDAGGQPLDYVWAICLVVAFLFVSSSWKIKDKKDSAVLECGGIFLISAGLLTYAAALLETGGISGRAIILAILFSSVLNMWGRSLLLIRRYVWVRKIVS